MEDFFDTCTKDEIIAQWQDGQCEIERLARELEEESARAEAAEAKAKLCDRLAEALRAVTAWWGLYGTPEVSEPERHAAYDNAKCLAEAALAEYDKLEDSADGK